MSTTDRVKAAAALLRRVNDEDPGLLGFSLNDRQRVREQRLAAHWRAYGVREALDELGFLNDAVVKMGYGNVDS